MTGCAIPTSEKTAGVFDLRCRGPTRSGRWGRAIRSRERGEKGMVRRFYSKFLKGIKKNEEFVEFTKMDLQFLRKQNFDPMWIRTVNEATEVTSVAAIPRSSPKSYKIFYEWEQGGESVRDSGFSGSVPFIRLANELHIMSDEKAGVYRTAYMGVVAVQTKGTQLYLVPRSGPSFVYSS